MAYYYVKHTGSSTTAGGTTKKTGPFSGLVATAVYGSIKDAITYGATSGDVICVSDAHSINHGAADVNWVGPSSGQPLKITTVEDLLCENSAVASLYQETVTQAFDIGLWKRLRLYGIKCNIGGDIEIGSTDSDVAIENCYFRYGTSILSGSGAYRNVLTSINSTLDGPAGFASSIGNLFYMTGGALTATNYLFREVKLYELTSRMNGIDLSSLTGPIVNNFGGGSSDGTINIEIHDCKMSSSYSVANETFQKNEQRVSIFGSSHNSAASEYQFLIEAAGGKVEDQADSGIHRDESTAFPSGTKVSASCLTDTLASTVRPFWFELPARNAELSTATDTLRVYLTSETALDDTDVWVEVLYADGTNKHEQNYITTQNSNRMIVASGGTALTTDSGSTWKDGASDIAGTFNEYYIDIDTSGNAGADCVPTIKINVAIPSTQIYFDVAVDVV